MSSAIRLVVATWAGLALAADGHSFADPWCGYNRGQPLADDVE